jgi:hypothetical protein
VISDRSAASDGCCFKRFHAEDLAAHYNALHHGVAVADFKHNGQLQEQMTLIARTRELSTGSCPVLRQAWRRYKVTSLVPY